MTGDKWAIMMVLVDLTAGIGAGVTLYLWLRGSIFAAPRAKLEAWRDLGKGWRGFVGQLLLCPPCQNFWLCCLVSPLIVTMLGDSILPPNFEGSPFVWKFVVGAMHGAMITGISLMMFFELDKRGER